MQIPDIESVLKESLSLTELVVTGDGSHFQIIAVSDMFADMSRVKKQQTVYAPLKPFIADGSLHAVSIKTFTPEQWVKEKKFNMPGAL
ncbi:BolA family protein [Neptunicella marina]|uniref:BolA family transcriptional regulator n=1 Tax=Neptunicella marina TaxID=2125989 RepID=A0A8J6IT06_9ALTE|nr:BolA family protein [Neptunicella marina]MBC3765255.1 BolA family transcriptional regulator [Neptunicella marina]